MHKTSQEEEQASLFESIQVRRGLKAFKEETKGLKEKREGNGSKYMAKKNKWNLFTRNDIMDDVKKSKAGTEILTQCFSLERMERRDDILVFIENARRFNKRCPSRHVFQTK